MTVSSSKSEGLARIKAGLHAEPVVAGILHGGS